MTGRKKLDRTSLHARVDPETPQNLRMIAEKLGYKYSDEGSIGQLFDAIAQGKIILLHQDFSAKLVDAYGAIEYKIKCEGQKIPHTEP
jgi:hypothetical protein